MSFSNTKVRSPGNGVRLLYMRRSCHVLNFNSRIRAIVRDELFPPYNHILTDETLQMSRCPIVIFVEIVQVNYAISSTSLNLLV